jgi:transcriptional regulator with XRE-family HTH domain
MSAISEILYNARKQRNLVLRKVAAAVDIDQSLISKFEKGERVPTKEQIIKLSKFYGIPQKEFLIDIVSEKVVRTIQEYEFAESILKVAEEKIEYLNSKRGFKKQKNNLLDAK